MLVGIGKTNIKIYIVVILFVRDFMCKFFLLYQLFSILRKMLVDASSKFELKIQILLLN